MNDDAAISVWALTISVDSSHRMNEVVEIMAVLSSQANAIMLNPPSCIANNQRANVKQMGIWNETLPGPA